MAEHDNKGKLLEGPAKCNLATQEICAAMGEILHREEGRRTGMRRFMRFVRHPKHGNRSLTIGVGYLRRLGEPAWTLNHCPWCGESLRDGVEEAHVEATTADVPRWMR